MYSLLLILHSYTRWLVLLLAAWALYRAYTGWFGKQDWTADDRRAGVLLAAVMTVQQVLGLLLYFYPGSPALTALSDIGAAMRDRELRFFSVEHILVMLIAVALAHIGGAQSRKAPTPLARHRQAAIWFTLMTIAVLFAIPWWRPLLRGPG